MEQKYNFTRDKTHMKRGGLCRRQLITYFRISRISLCIATSAEDQCYLPHRQPTGAGSSTQLYAGKRVLLALLLLPVLRRFQVLWYYARPRAI